jgi:hypothetical protein
MDWSWLPPLVVGVALSQGVRWIDRWWEDRARKSRDKKARLDGRFEEVRGWLVSAGELANQGSMIAGWVARRPSDLERREWLERARAKIDEVYGSPVAVATGLFAQDERLLGKLYAVSELLEELYKRAAVCASGKDHEDVRVLKARIATLTGEAQELMDGIVDEL